MSASPVLSEREHVAIRELLPFFVNQTLSEHESARVSRHVAGCASCSREIDEQRRLGALLRAAPGREGDAQAAWLRMERRLQSESTASPARWSASRPERVWRLAAAVAVVLLIPAVAYFASRQSTPYRTATSQPAVPAAAGGAIRAVFAPRTTLRDIEGLLQDAGYQIVSGPSPRGVYTLAPVTQDADGHDAALAALRASPLVALAEPVAENLGKP